MASDHSPNAALRWDQAPPQAPNLDIEFPDIAVPTDFKGAFLGPQNAGGNSQVIPLVRINPQYPRNELLAGVEGWVKVRFTVEPDGSVSSPKVIQSKPPRVFDTAALRAIKKWKFKPKVVNGIAVQQDGTQLIEFKLFKYEKTINVNGMPKTRIQKSINWC